MLFWKLLFAHTLTDFLFQPDFIAENKKKLKYLVIHICIFFFLSLVFLLPNISYAIVFSLICLSLFHGIVDFLKNWIQSHLKKKAWYLFIGDQFLHIVGIGILVEIVQKNNFIEWGNIIRSLWTNPKFFIIASFVVFIVLGGGYFTGLVCTTLFKSFINSEKKIGLEKAGRYIGIFERSLIIVAVLINKYEFIGFLLAAKSIARYPEIKEDLPFAEYYLVGTLTSVAIAILGSLVLLQFIS